MRRITSLLAIAALTALTTSACATKHTSERSIARPAPNSVGLSDWFASNPAGASERPAFFIQMADTQLGMSGLPLWLGLLGATWNDDAFEIDARLFESAIAHANEL